MLVSVAGDTKRREPLGGCDLAKNEPDRRERAKIAGAGGYSAKLIEGLLSKRRKENETE